MATITICSSAAFYKQATQARDELLKLGYQVIIPSNARKMEETGDFDVSHYKTWFGNADDYHKKAALMREHCDEVGRGDAVLVLNYEKHGAQNYIGGNVLMEMALGFYQNKPIFLINDVPADSPFLEEILGMSSVPLKGDLAELTKTLPVT